LALRDRRYEEAVMDKNLALKLVFIIVLVVVGVWTLYPPDKTLKPGIDLAGGTSLVYEIDTQGLGSEEKRELSSKMITVLRRRIDPANIQNLVSGQHPESGVASAGRDAV
jgi:preprotein translocase subunit SecD